MRIAVLFDGAGLARLGLEQAGHECTGFELDPVMHYLGQFVGSGNCVLADATKIDVSKYDAVWASPPCQTRTSCIKDLSKRGGIRNKEFANDYLQWCLDWSGYWKISWIENVRVMNRGGNDWGTLWNAAQFLQHPIQSRQRVIGGHYLFPHVFREFKRYYQGVCFTITGTEYKASGATDKCRASRFYGRNLTLEECAYHQGFSIPQVWLHLESGFGITPAKWRHKLYNAIGNGVPVYMARAFGEVYK